MQVTWGPSGQGSLIMGGLAWIWMQLYTRLQPPKARRALLLQPQPR